MAARQSDTTTKKKIVCCPKCKKTVGENSKSLCCEYCVKWYHAKCEGITDDEYDLLNKCASKVHWFCSVCDDKAVDVLRLVQTMKDTQNKMQSSIDNLALKVDNIANLKDETFCDKVRSLVREEIHENLPEIEKVIDTKIEKIEKDIETKIASAKTSVDEKID